ncbi:MAG: rod shape-determining protein MreC [Chitinophagaceae bacterium]
MRNIILFIRRFFNLICFIILQIVCFVMLSKFSKSHEVFFGSELNETTGKINRYYNGFYAFFSLKEVNNQLQKENALLRNQLLATLKYADSSIINKIDSSITDTTGKFRKFTYLPALVVGNNLHTQNNYLTLERGKLQGVEKGMGVVGPNGVVGEVVSVSDNFSVVMSVLNRNSKISSMLLKDKNTGSIEWDGRDPQLLTLKNIPKSVKVTKGDSVVTSTYSSKFPANLMVGTVYKVNTDPSSNVFTIIVKASTNFYALQQVYIIKNVRYAEQRDLELLINTKSND